MFMIVVDLDEFEARVRSAAKRKNRVLPDHLDLVGDITRYLSKNFSVPTAYTVGYPALAHSGYVSTAFLDDLFESKDIRLPTSIEPNKFINVYQVNSYLIIEG